MLAAQTAILDTDGKFFRIRGERVFLKVVTYGPFPVGGVDHGFELVQIVQAGFHAVRVYGEPDFALLDAAQANGLFVIVGLEWEWDRVFTGNGFYTIFENVKEGIRRQLEKWGQHPAVVSCLVANEVRPDIARWLGVELTRGSLEELIDLVKLECPHLLVAYASYPSSEYLEPRNADYTAMNVYLESEADYRSYLRRLHHIAGDRPLLISEFGFDTFRSNEQKQAEVLRWGVQVAQSEGSAGWTCFAWSDLWYNGGRLVNDWAFGLVTSAGCPKLAFGVIREDSLEHFPMPLISVIVCVYNGVQRVGGAVESLRNLNYPNYEVLVVDDGSTDGTLELLEQFDFIRIIHSAHLGLSVARNSGASAAKGEILSYIDDDCEADRDYLYWLAKAYAANDWGACGGPNIPPPAEVEDEAVVACAPGAPSHVMLSDVEAEHIPGCHLSVRKAVFDEIGGFGEQYWVAGDDVDFCWRLREAGYKIGFHGGSFVWHRRRTNWKRYLKQQWGYGRAESLLMESHPEYFGKNGIRWEGCVYVGSVTGISSASVIYHGLAGESPYQMTWATMMPQRLLAREWFSFSTKWKLIILSALHPYVRGLSRKWYSGHMTLPQFRCFRRKYERSEWVDEYVSPVISENLRAILIQRLQGEGWQYAGEYSEWDLTYEDSMLLVVAERLGDSWRIRVRFEGLTGKNIVQKLVFNIAD
ncbi:MAG: glycosyltransferase [Rubritalea sp.]|uniref:glycosyltransferase n=1 Tax=Rubritalea sp. TaxID=2109375 RepID=UPI00324290BF